MISLSQLANDIAFHAIYCRAILRVLRFYAGAHTDNINVSHNGGRHGENRTWDSQDYTKLYWPIFSKIFRSSVFFPCIWILLFNCCKLFDSDRFISISISVIYGLHYVITYSYIYIMKMYIYCSIVMFYHKMYYHKNKLDVSCQI